MAVYASIMVLGFLNTKISPNVVISLCELIVQRLESHGVFVFIEKVVNFRQVRNTERGYYKGQSSCVNLPQFSNLDVQYVITPLSCQNFGICQEPGTAQSQSW